MVKGVSRRVIVVNTPDPRLFEQAIFILKEDAFHRGGVSADDVVAEARRVADGYVLRNTLMGRRLRRPLSLWQRLLFLLIGAAAASAVWAALMLYYPGIF